MSEVANTSAGVERVLGWSAAGAGLGLAGGSVLFARFAETPWPLVSGAILLVVGVGLGFAAFVRDGGLNADDDKDSKDDQDRTWDDNPPPYFAALGSILTFALVFGVMAGMSTRAGSAEAASERRSELVPLPGFTVSLPVTPTVDRQPNSYRATLAGWPPGDFAIEWQTEALDLETLEGGLDAQYGAQESTDAVTGGDFRGTLWSFRNRSDYTTVVAGSCRNGPWITLTAHSEAEDYATELARSITGSIQCTSRASAPATTRPRPRQTARASNAAPPVPRFVMPASFGAVPTSDGFAFRSLAGDTLAFRAVPLAEGSTLLRGRLETALAGRGVAVEEFAPTTWPEGSARREPVYSFTRTEGDKSTQGLVTVLLCPTQGRAYVAISLAQSVSDNQQRLESIACPLAGEPAPAYETLLASAERACGAGNNAACDARAGLASAGDFRVLALP